MKSHPLAGKATSVWGLFVLSTTVGPWRVRCD